MKPRASGSSIHSLQWGAALALAWFAVAVGQDRGVATPAPLKIRSYEYFPERRDAEPPALGEVGPERSRGSVVTDPPEPYGTRWLRARISLPQLPAQMHGLYIYAANYGLSVFINGVQIGNTSVADAEQFSWNYPLYFSVPPSLLEPGANVIDLRMRLLAGGYSTVVGAEFGLHQDLKPVYDRILFWRVTGPQITALITVLIAAIALLIWTRRRHESVFGWFAAACMLATIRNAHFYVNLSVPEQWYEIWAGVPFHWMSAAWAIFAFRLCEDRLPRIETTILASALAWSIAIVFLPGLWAVDLGYVWLLLITLGVCVYVAIQCWRAPRMERLLLLAAALVTLVFGVMDALLLMGVRASASRIYLMPYSTLFFGLVMGAVLVDAFVKARSQQERLNRELDAKLAQREGELHEQHGRLLRLESERVATQERQRILRDIHDGLGTQLISSIQLVETGSLAPVDIAQLLRECVDDLRLAIDSLKPAGDDLLLVLGNFRYRMEPRLQAVGMQVDWQVNPEAQSPRLSSGQVLHVLRIVQETFTNTLKHACAGTVLVKFEVNAATQQWTLLVADDGCGFSTEHENRGDGLRNMQARALQAGVCVEVTSSGSGTCVRIGSQR